MTPQWRATAEEQRDQLRAQATAANEAFLEAKHAAVRALTLVTPVPQVLLQNDGVLDPIDKASAITAWQRWSAPLDEHVTAESLSTPEDLDALAQHLETALPGLTQAVASLNEAAANEVARRDGHWAALALFGDADAGYKAADEVEKRWGKSFPRTLRDLNRGTHDGHQGDLDLLISDTRSLVAKIPEALK